MCLINPYKMTCPQEKTECVSWFIEKNWIFRPIVTIELSMENPQSHPSIHLWHKKLQKTGTLLDTGRSGRPRTSEEKIERVR